MHLIGSNLKGNWTLLSLHCACRLGIGHIDVDVNAHGWQVLLHVGHDIRQSHLRVANVDRLLVVIATGQHGEFASLRGLV